MKNKNSFSFTLIELLVALGIFAVIAIALYSAFSVGVTVWKRSSSGGNVYQNVRFVYSDITKDLKNILYFSKDKESIYAFSGMPQEIVFMALEDTYSTEEDRQKEIVRLSYRFDAEKNELIRLRADISAGFDIEKSGKEVLLGNVEEFKFEYCYDSEDEDKPYLWEDEWEDDDMRIPRGARITSLIRAGENKRETLKFTKIIFIPTGVLGEKEL